MWAHLSGEDDWPVGKTVFETGVKVWLLEGEAKRLEGSAKALLALGILEVAGEEASFAREEEEEGEAKPLLLPENGAMNGYFLPFLPTL